MIDNGIAIPADKATLQFLRKNFGKRFEALSPWEKSTYYQCCGLYGEGAERKDRIRFFCMCLGAFLEKKGIDYEDEKEPVSAEYLLYKMMHNPGISDSTKKDIESLISSLWESGTFERKFSRILMIDFSKGPAEKIDLQKLEKDLAFWDYNGGRNLTRSNWAETIFREKEKKSNECN